MLSRMEQLQVLRQMCRQPAAKVDCLYSLTIHVHGLCVCVCVRTYVCVCTCVYVCVCIITSGRSSSTSTTSASTSSSSPPTSASYWGRAALGRCITVRLVLRVTHCRQREVWVLLNFTLTEATSSPSIISRASLVEKPAIAL